MAREIKFAETLGELLKNRGYTRNHAAVAKGVSLTPSAISQYLKGRSQPSLSALIALAEFLETDLDYLVFGESAAPSSAPNPAPFARYVDASLAELQARTADHASLVGRIGEVLGAQIDQAARDLVKTRAGRGLAGMIDDEETLLLESYSLRTKVLPMNLDYDVILSDDGTAAPGRFLLTVFQNLRAGRPYEFLLPQVEGSWKSIVDKYRVLLREHGATDRDLTFCEFKESQHPLAVGYGIYQLDVARFRADHPILFERLRRSIDDDDRIGYTLPVSPDLKADAVMDVVHLTRAVRTFDMRWKERGTTSL
jgi:transcriptional regulator with XRE-family HTH domain